LFDTNLSSHLKGPTPEKVQIVLLYCKVADFFSFVGEFNLLMKRSWLKIFIFVKITNSFSLFAAMNNKLDPSQLKEGEDYYFTPEGYKCFTAQYHLKRGYCCKSGCRHCPYGFDKKTGTNKKQDN